MYSYTVNRAKEIGFDLCGISKAEAVDSGVVSHVEQWISKGRSASLGWMDGNKDIRYDPSKFPDLGVKSIIVCAISYQTLDTLLPHPIASYARAADYHFIIKNLLTALHLDIEKEYGIEISGRAFSDSAPILERYWAVKSGLGWIGKSSMLINRDIGSYFLVGTLLLGIEFDKYDSPSDFDGCGSCVRCIDSCKSGAILSDKIVDCNRCLSYITIEHRGDYTDNQRDIIKKWDGDSIFGCDRCMSVCPWSIKASKKITSQSSAEKDTILRRFEMPSSIDEWGSITSSEFKKRYKQTPLSRAGYKKIVSTIDVLIDNNSSLLEDK